MRPATRLSKVIHRSKVAQAVQLCPTHLIVQNQELPENTFGIVLTAEAPNVATGIIDAVSDPKGIRIASDSESSAPEQDNVMMDSGPNEDFVREQKMYAFQSDVVKAEGSSFSVPNVMAEIVLLQFLLSAGLPAPTTRLATVCLNTATKSALVQSLIAQKVKNIMNRNNVHLNLQVQNSSIHSLNVSTQLKSFKDALSSRNGNSAVTHRASVRLNRPAVRPPSLDVSSIALIESFINGTIVKMCDKAIEQWIEFHKFDMVGLLLWRLLFFPLAFP
ncbi:hypothetical protein HPP92_006400 [Vanilla planifolia]|uniref:Uncharacterized protein n=1 Tax=Vanilla planifolia TaxID=51239 RepID=A0A835RVU8_VANPL|nr:hypothetical protein HPP92_006400 [Vanilla planifolia]